MDPLRQRRGLSQEESRPLSSVLEREDTMSTSFDQLKREAVNLERQLEDKISRYQQVSGTAMSFGITTKCCEGGEQCLTHFTLLPCLIILACSKIKSIGS